jgi:short subunit fatty acids transporter
MAKNSKKTINLVIFIVGIALILWGVNEYGLFANEIARNFTGISDKVMILWIFGGVLTVIGGMRLFKR